jgi:hypothetical protein
VVHPPVLFRQNQPLVYGNGIPAYWNSGEPVQAEQKGVNGVSKDNKANQPALPDAKLYATWQWDAKDYRIPLAITSNKTRARINSAQSAGTISLATGRERRASKAA